MNDINPRISIGLPIYNAENFLQEALDSILNQTFEDFELIISDNASTDNTEGICREYAAKDHRIRYYRNEQNIGAARNYNRVAELSNSKYFRWANHDDLCAPELLEQCIEALEHNPNAVLSYPRTIIIDEQGRHIAELMKELGINSPKPHQRFKRYRVLHRKKASESQEYKTSLYMPIYGVIRTELLKKTALIGCYIASDIVLLDELALLGEFYEVPEYLFFKRKHQQKGTKANYGYDQRILWFDSRAKNRKLLFPKWRLFFESICAIERSPISWYEKINCYIEMGKYFLWNWRTLAIELSINLCRVLNIKSISLLGFKKELPKVW